MFRIDVVLEILLASTLVGAQALVLSNLGIPFAAITLFAGLGGYLAAAGSMQGGLAPFVLILVAATVLLGLFHGLRRSLPNDRYLLLSLAALQLAAASAGASQALGGQLGAKVSWIGLPTYDAAACLPVAVLSFCAILFLLWICERSEFGFAVELTRLSRSDERLRALVPADRVSLLVLAAAILLAGAVGATKGLYSGRVSPDDFSLDLAISTLVATLVAGRKAWTVAVVALAFFAFPHVFSSLLGYQIQAMGHLREILWSGLILLWGHRLTERDGRFGLRKGAP